MKKIFHVILLITFCTVINPVFANAVEKSNDNDLDPKNVQDKKSPLREQKRFKKKKGQNKIIIRPDDDKIILTLDQKTEEDEESDNEK